MKKQLEFEGMPVLPIATPTVRTTIGRVSNFFSGELQERINIGARRIAQMMGDAETYPIGSEFKFQIDLSFTLVDDAQGVDMSARFKIKPPNLRGLDGKAFLGAENFLVPVDNFIVEPDADAGFDMERS